MLPRRLEALMGLVIMFGLIGPISLPVTAPPLGFPTVLGLQTAGWSSAYTDYKSTAYGIQASILVTDATPASGSEVFALVTVGMPNGGWLQVGWVKGLTPKGTTGSSVMYYTEYCTSMYYDVCNGSYDFELQGTATVGSTHTFTVVYSGCQVSCTAYYWYALIDGVSKASVALQQKTAILEAQAESHNGQDQVPQGRFSALQYYVPYGRGWRWYPWNGYGAYGAFSPFTQTIVSTTEWTYTEN